MGESYTKLFNSIVTSTVWTEDSDTKVVWITMLALADRHGEVQGSAPGIARLAGVTLEACTKALEKFLSPDPHSRTPDFEGRRIEKVDGGWSLLNHGKYMRMASKEDQMDKSAERSRRYRQRVAERDRHGPSRSVTDSHATPRSVTRNRPDSDSDVDVDVDKKDKSKVPSGTFGELHLNEEDAAAGIVRGDLGRALESYNAAANRVGWQRASKLTPARRASLEGRLRDAKGLDGWNAAIARAEASDFLAGRTGRENGHSNWRVDLDFLLGQKKFLKLLEGGYDNRRAPAKSEGMTW